MDKYNTFGRRFWAGFIDGLVFIPITFMDDFMSSSSAGQAALIVWSIISYSIYWLYSVLLHARYGQTLGKMVAKVSVLDVSEKYTPSFRQAMLRDSGYIAINSLALIYAIYLILNGLYVQGAEHSTLPGQILAWCSLGWFFLEIVTMLTNKKRRAFHDVIAGTVVVRVA